MSIEAEHANMHEVLTLLVKVKKRKAKYGARDMEYQGMRYGAWIRAEKVLKDVDGRIMNDKL